MLANADVGIINYDISEAKGTFTFVNNLGSTIRLDEVRIDGTPCWFIGSNARPHIISTLAMGERVTLSCGSIAARGSYEYAVEITYTLSSSNSRQTISDLIMAGLRLL